MCVGAAVACGTGRFTALTRVYSSSLQSPSFLVFPSFPPSPRVCVVVVGAAPATAAAPPVLRMVLYDHPSRFTIFIRSIIRNQRWFATGIAITLVCTLIHITYRINYVIHEQQRHFEVVPQTKIIPQLTVARNSDFSFAHDPVALAAVAPGVPRTSVGDRYLALIHTQPGDEDRFSTVKRNLEHAFPGFFRFRSNRPLTYEDQRVIRTSQHFPNVDLGHIATKYTFFDAWSTIGADPQLGDDDWAFIFEDDIAIAPPTPAETAAATTSGKPIITNYGPMLKEVMMSKQVRADGWIWLGICNPSLKPGTARLSHYPYSKDVVNDFTSSRANGFCSHAHAVTRRRARTLITDFGIWSPHHLNTSTLVPIDHLLNHFFSERGPPPYLFASHRQSPLSENHIGLIYQDRKQLKSKLQTFDD